MHLVDDARFASGLSGKMLAMVTEVHSESVNGTVEIAST